MLEFEDYARRGRNEGWRYIAGLLLALVLAFVFQVAATIPAMLTGLISQGDAANLVHPSTPKALGIVGASFGLILAAVAVAARLVQQKRFNDLLGRWSWGQAGLGAAVWLAIIGLAALIDYAVAPQVFARTASAGTLAFVAVAIPALALQTLTEEVIFRGWITQGLLLWLKRPWVVALAGGLVFGAAHILNGVHVVVNAAILGAALSLIAIRSGGLGFGWGLHLVNNLFGAVVVVSRQDIFAGAPGLFVQNAPGLVWLDVATTSVGVIAIALWRARKGGVRQAS